MAKKLSKKSFLNLTPSEIGKMKSPELRNLIRGARNLFNAQEKTFKKYEKTVYSPALEKMQSYYDNISEDRRSPSKMRIGQMRNEIFRLQEFFSAETSTVPGSRRVAREQDIRIFGTNKSGSPKRRMSVEERTAFWSAYQEFISLESESYIRNMGSNTIQQYLGEIMTDNFKKGNFDFSMADFNSLKTQLENRRSMEEWESAGYDLNKNTVFSDKRNDY